MDEGKYLELVRALYKAQANAFVLYSKTWGCHWNVNGSNFPQYHSLLSDLYTDMGTNIDRIAENIRSLGYKAPSMLTVYLQLSDVKEIDGSQDALTMIGILYEDQSIVINSLKTVITEAQAVGCEAVINMAGDLSESYSSYIFKLGATLGK